MSFPVAQQECSESKPLMSPQGRKQGVSMTKIQERKNQISKLHTHGYTTRAITQLCNSVAAEKQWGTIGERQVQRIVSEHGLELKYQSALEEYGMREAHIARLEDDLMRMLRRLNTKKDWIPFEEIHAFTACANALQRIINIRGFNMSRSKNYLTNKQSYLPPEPPDYSDCPARKDIIEYIDSLLNSPEIA